MNFTRILHECTHAIKNFIWILQQGVRGITIISQIVFFGDRLVSALVTEERYVIYGGPARTEDEGERSYIQFLCRVVGVWLPCMCGTYVYVHMSCGWWR